MNMLIKDLTPGDFWRATYLHLRPRPVLAVAGILILLMFLLAFIGLIFSSQPWDFSIFLIPGVFIYLGLRFFVILPWQVSKNFKQNSFLKDNGVYEINEEGLYAKSDFGEQRVPWDHFRKWKESRRTILLYFTDVNFCVISRRLLNEEEWNQLRELASKNLKKIN